MEIIKEAYYLQILYVFIMLLDFLGSFFPTLSFLSIGIIIFSSFQFLTAYYVLMLYNLLLQIPRMLAYYYIIKNKKVIKEYSKFLIYLSYLMFGLIFLSFFTSIIITYYLINIDNLGIPPILTDLLFVANFLSFGSIILILLVSNFKNLKYVKIWLILHYLIGIADAIYFSFAEVDPSQIGTLTFLTELARSIIVIYMIRSLFLFAKNDIKLISE